MSREKISIESASLIEFNSIEDDRGILTSIEGEESIPFVIKRVFYMHHLKSDRGGHSHIDTDQVVIPINGSFTVSINDGKLEKSFFLDDCKTGLYIPRRLFTTLFNFKMNDVCLVLANTHYNIAKSQRNWQGFLDMKKKIENA
jgi:dTDP-4-dehydrorhamnose 3,5-epimerase-like enzyme